MKMYTRIFCASLILLSALHSFATCTTYTNPTITITSLHSDTICTAGTSSTFNATISGGGGSPVYQWVLNGVYVGGNSSSFTAVLNNNDVVSCNLTSSLACVTNPTVSSNAIRMAVDEVGAATITPATDCQGNPLTISGAGAASSIIWQKSGAALDTAIALPAYYNSIIRGGGNGSGTGLNQLKPQGVWVDSVGDVYASDAANNRILKFAKGSTSASSGVVVAGGNGSGSAANQLNNPKGVYVDKQGNLWVADYGNSRIQKFPAGSTSATNGVTVAGGAGYIGNNANDLAGPTDVQLDDSGYIYVLDKTNNVIAQYPPNAVPGATASYVSGTFFQGQQPIFNGMWITGNGTIYASDINLQLVYEFPSFDAAVTIGQIQWTIAGGNGAGSANNQLSNPSSIYLDPFGNMFVADAGNHRIQKFVLSNVSTVTGTTVVANTPATVLWLDGQDNIYTAETNTYDVREYINGTGIDTVYTPLTPGTYNAVVTTTGNCRSFTTQAVTVLPNPTSTVNGITCLGTAYHVGNSYSHTSPGTYIDTLFNASASGCDSIVTLHLQVDSNSLLQTQIYQNNDSLTIYIPTAPAETYIWTLNGASFTGDSGSTIHIQLNGQYAVTGTDSNGCAVSPAPVSVTSLGINTISNYMLNVQPNPSNGRFTLTSQQAEGKKYIISNILGQQITEGTITGNNQPISLTNAAPGVYLLQVKDDTHTSAPVRIVVEGR